MSVGLHERIFLGPVILFCGKLNPYLQLVQCMGHLFTYRVYAKKDGSVETVCHIIMAARQCDNYQKTVYALSAGLDKIWGEPWFTKKLVMRTNIIEIHYGKLIMG